MIDAAFSMA